MARSHQTFNKLEKQKKKRKKREAKLERKRQRKIDKAESGPKTFEDMISYVDEDGNFSSTPPDPSKKKQIKAEDIDISVPKRQDFDPIRKGQVKFFSQDKGYGFINDLETGEGIFVHVNNVEGMIDEKDFVTYEIEIGPKGQYASNVRLSKNVKENKNIKEEEQKPAP